MDSKPIRDIRICRSCDELSIWNYYEAQKRNDYSYLVYGWDGWPSMNYLPIDTKEHFDNITNEWAEITKNNKALQHFELIAEYSDKVTRAEIVAGLLKSLQKSWVRLSKEKKKEYIDELKEWGFLFRGEKDIRKEFERLLKQWKASLVKIRQLESEIKKFDDNTPTVELAEVKATVQRITKMQLNLKETSMVDWHFILQDAIKNKAA